MKIGIDCRLWNETGVGRYIRNLILNLQTIDKDNNYVVFVLSRDKEEILNSSKRTFLSGGGAVQNDKFKIIEADIKWHTLDEQLKFPKILKRENLDLVHFPYFSVPIFYNRPYVVTIHDLIQYHYSSGHASTLPLPIYNLKLVGYKFVLNQAARKAEKIITVSNATKNEIIDHLKIKKDKIVVTYEGADQVIQNSKFKIQNYNSKLKINDKYYLYVGNAYPHKNLERLLKAFKISNIDAKLVLVGKEDVFYERLKCKVGEMGLSEKVVFLQNISDEELSNLYQKALALILPSLMEGFGLPALEAMANNCLVLCSNIPAIQEVCGDAAIYFDPYKINDIAKAMNDVYSNDAYHYSDKKKEGLEQAKLFSWQKMAKETLLIYERSIMQASGK